MHNSHQFRKMCLDPEVYKNPEEFRPERFMGPTPEEDPSTTAVFGFGRRYVGFFSPMPETDRRAPCKQNLSGAFTRGCFPVYHNCYVLVGIRYQTCRREWTSCFTGVQA